MMSTMDSSSHPRPPSHSDRPQLGVGTSYPRDSESANPLSYYSWIARIKVLLSESGLPSELGPFETEVATRLYWRGFEPSDVAALLRGVHGVERR